jgi:hypothetical protein
MNLELGPVRHLTLGIGANVVVFGVVNAVLLRPLNVNDPQNLYQLRLGSWTNGKLLTTSYPAFGDIRQRNNTFSVHRGFYGYCQARLRFGDAVRVSPAMQSPAIISICWECSRR